MTRILSAALLTSLLGGTAFAQDAVPEAVPEPVPVVPMEAPPAAPAAPTMMETAPAPVMATPAAADSGVKISVFADSYYNYSTSKNDANILAAPPGQIALASRAPAHRAYERHNGFGLSFLGADLTYDTEKFGATASLRFGPSVPIFYAVNKTNTGIENITQAFVTYKPTSSLSVDFGQFTTIYGAEVAESWKNLNYTRGGLYYAMQPFWHTGARVKYAVSSELTLTGMVVNGVNNEIDSGKELPSLGGQVAYTTAKFAVLLGYLGNLDPKAGESVFDHFVDLVATANVDKLSFVFNADYAKDEAAAFFGVSLAARLALTDEFGIAVRGEYLADPDGIVWKKIDAMGMQVSNGDSNNVMTGTGTLDWKPGGSGKLIIRWDNRFEKSAKDVFFDRDGKGTGTWFQSVLGVVVTSA